MKRIAVTISIVCVCLASLAGPATATVAVVGGLTRQVTLQPGSSVEGRIVVRNLGDKPQEVEFHQTDYLFRADGKTTYGETGSVTRSSAPWINIFPQQVTVPPGGSDSVSYIINVPEDAHLCGTFWSVVMVQPVTSELLEPPKPEEGEVHIGIRTVMRHAIQMVIHIGDTGERALRFASRQLLVANDKRILQLDVENVGERWLVPQVWAELYDQQGQSVGRFEGGQFRTYPGCSARFRIDLSDVPVGSYKALVVADCGGAEVFGAQYDVEFP